MIATGSDLLVQLKGNHPKLLAAVQDVCGTQPLAEQAYQADLGRRNRIEQRTARVWPLPEGTGTELWHDHFKAVVEVRRRVECFNPSRRCFEPRNEPTAYYLVTRTASAETLAQAIRGHWGIESVPQAHGKEVQDEPTNCVEAARKMRGGPSESAFRSGLQTTPSCCGQEPSVVSVGVKASRMYLEQVGIRETNASEPSMTRRNPENCRQNQGRFDLLGPACRTPDYWASGGRRIGGVKLIQASVWNCGNQSLRWQGRSTSGRNHEARVPMRSTGTDRFIVATKAGNAAGAKGSDQAAAFGVQLATGGNE